MPLRVRLWPAARLSTVTYEVTTCVFAMVVRSSSTGITRVSGIMPRSCLLAAKPRARGGPQPAEFGGDVEEFAAFVAGFFAALAGLEPPKGAPRVRGFQQAQLEAALPWARSVLGV